MKKLAEREKKEGFLPIYPLLAETVKKTLNGEYSSADFDEILEAMFSILIKITREIKNAPTEAYPETIEYTCLLEKLFSSCLKALNVLERYLEEQNPDYLTEGLAKVASADDQLSSFYQQLKANHLDILSRCSFCDFYNLPNLISCFNCRLSSFVLNEEYFSEQVTFRHLVSDIIVFHPYLQESAEKLLEEEPSKEEREEEFEGSFIEFNQLIKKLRRKFVNSILEDEELITDYDLLEEALEMYEDSLLEFREYLVGKNQDYLRSGISLGKKAYQLIYNYQEKSEETFLRGSFAF